MTKNGIGATANVVVHAHGRVSPTDHAYAHHKLGRLQRLVPRAALTADVDIVVRRSPAREPTARATALLEANGRVVRADAEATSVRRAVDVLELRLRRELEPLGDLSDG